MPPSNHAPYGVPWTSCSPTISGASAASYNLPSDGPQGRVQLAVLGVGPLEAVDPVAVRPTGHDHGLSARDMLTSRDLDAQAEGMARHQADWRAWRLAATAGLDENAWVAGRHVVSNGRAPE